MSGLKSFFSSTKPTVVAGGTQKLNLTADTAVKTGTGALLGIHVNSSSAGTVKIYDNTAASGTVIINTYTPTVGWNPMPFTFNTGLYIDVTGTIDLTVSYS